MFYTVILRVILENTRRNAYDATFKLKAIDLAVEEGNRAAKLPPMMIFKRMTMPNEKLPKDIV